MFNMFQVPENLKKKKQGISLKWDKLLGFRANSRFQAKYNTVHLGIDKTASSR